MSPHHQHWPLEPGLAFLNHGSFGACPLPVLEEQSRLRAEMEREPVRFLWREIEERLDAARAVLAEFLGAAPEDVVFVSNATTAVNSVVRSLRFAPGDELLTIDHAYNACRNVLEATAERCGARVVVASVPFPLEGKDAIVDAVLSAVTERTRLLLLDHVTSPTALVLPVEEIVRAAEARGVPVLVDGAHAPGMVPLDLGKLGASYYTGNLHKWVCAPKGSAFLFVRRDRQAGIHPAVVSHGFNTPRLGRSLFHDEFDWQGTLDVTGWLSVPTALRFGASLFPGGWPELMRHNHELAIAARRLLCARLALAPPCPESMLGSMATLPLPATLQQPSGESRAVVARFDPLQSWLFHERKIEVPVVVWGSPPVRWFRISAHAHNGMADFERLAEALTEVKDLPPDAVYPSNP